MSLLVASPQFCLFCHDMISVDSRYIANIDLTAKYKEQTGHLPPSPSQLHLEISEGEGESHHLSQRYQNNILLEHQYAR